MDNKDVFMGFYGSGDELPFYGIIASLTFKDKEQFYGVLYGAITKHPSYVILSDLELERKLSILENLILYYQSKEDYEKCAKLLNIKKEVESDVKN